eukprot:GEMP01004089.1.p1 GENE.GEMP01004089.1~~GEMP01004089.1.p1  ORF type:complete len:1114 (+),score=343.21 GEMP01004089.1:92-3433(+)
MVKQKFTSLDARASLQSVDFLRGAKLTNIYDINSKLYILKFQHQKQSRDITCDEKAEKQQNKHFLLLEAGVRFHLTNFERDKSVIPSSYTMKLRKHLRSKRLEDVHQLGQDRVMVLQFGTGERMNYLILEMYVRGNLVLCDADWKILILLRTHVFGDDDRCAVKSEYPRNQRAMQAVTQEEVDGLTRGEFEAVITKELENAASQGKKPMPSHMLLCKCLTFAHPAMCTSVLKELGVSKPIDAVQSGMGEVLARGAQRCIDILNNVTLRRNDDESAPKDEGVKNGNTDEGTKRSSETFATEDTMRTERRMVPGFIQTRPMKGDRSKVTFEEFCPVESLLKGDIIKFDNFSDAVDTFFAQIEEQKYEEHKAQQETSIKNRVENIRQDQEKRLAVLLSDQELREQQATLVEMNIELVDQALLMINTGLAAGLDWNALDTQVKQTQKQGHAITSYIHQLDFERNEMAMILGNENDPNQDMLVVQLDLSLSAYANVGALHGARKQQKQKHKKTEIQAETALRNAEKKALADMKKFEERQQVKGLRKVRKHWWFEKFYWFISSENYLVLAGRDAQQNELLFRKYLANTDAYVHADITGASSVVIKNPSGGEIPPLTLQEAGTMTMCRSKAWENKVVISAWWVWGKQVSKTAPTGEFLVSGGFMIRGKKYFLPPLKLEMGLGLLFELTPECVSRHLGERVTKYQETRLGDTIQKSPPLEADPPSDEEDAPSGEENAPSDEEDAASDEENASSDEEAPVAAAEADADKTSTESAPAAPAVAPLDEEEEDIPRAKVDKYNLDVEEEEEDDIATEAARKNVNAGKVRMSKAERKRLKKGNVVEGDNGAANKDVENTKPAPSKEKEKGPLPPLRGQKTKNKKRAKYVDQDPEERELRMRLLGAKLPEPNIEDDAEASEVAAASADKQKDEEARVKGLSERKCFHCQQIGHLANECPAKNAARGKGRDGDDDEDEETHQFPASEVQLDILTGKPFTSDEVLGALAMCAPFTAVQNYHFKVKITPGTSKKGKLAQMAMRMFQTDALDVSSKYLEDEAQGAGHSGGSSVKVWREIARAIPDTELISVLVSAAKISSPGVQKVQVAMKKEKKKEAKRRKDSEEQREEG